MLSRYGAHYAVEKVCNSICMAFAYDLHIIFNEREICAFSLITWNITAYFCYALVETRYDYASLVINRSSVRSGTRIFVSLGKRRHGNEKERKRKNWNERWIRNVTRSIERDVSLVEECLGSHRCWMFIKSFKRLMQLECMRHLSIYTLLLRRLRINSRFLPRFSLSGTAHEYE